MTFKLTKMSYGNEDPMVVDGTGVEHVTQFNFLGSLVAAGGGCSAGLRGRVAMAESAMVGLGGVWTGGGITGAAGGGAPGLCASFPSCCMRMRVLDTDGGRPVWDRFL